jgi:hypothetical protein
MISLYRRAFAAVAQDWWYFLAMALIVEIGVGFFPESGWMSLVVLMFYLLVNYAIYRYHMLGVRPVLLGRPAPSDRPESFWRFAWVNAVLGGLTVGIIALLVIGAATVLNLLSPGPVFLQSAEIFANGGDGTIAASTAIVLLLYGLMMAIFGTMLPASAIGDPFGFGLTLDRARRTFWRVLPGLFAGTGALSLLTVAVALYLTTRTGIPIEMFDLDGAFSAAGLITGVTLQMVGFLGTHLGAIVLCDAYNATLPTAPDSIADTFA